MQSVAASAPDLPEMEAPKLGVRIPTTRKERARRAACVWSSLSLAFLAEGPLRREDGSEEELAGLFAGASTAASQGGTRHSQSLDTQRQMPAGRHACFSYELRPSRPTWQDPKPTRSPKAKHSGGPGKMSAVGSEGDLEALGACPHMQTCCTGLARSR